MIHPPPAEEDRLDRGVHWKNRQTRGKFFVGQGIGGAGCEEIRSARFMDADGGGFYTPQPAEERVSGVARPIDSSAGRVMGSFFPDVIRLSVPIQLFTAKEQAPAWLIRQDRT